MMGIDRAGAPFIGGAVVLAALAAVFGWWWAVPFVALAAFMAFFFRDPDRASVADPRVVLSPADGRVMVAGPGEPGVAPDGAWQQVSIFLSPMDVHVNRMPVSGRVTQIRYHPGRFLPAYRREAGDLNEYTEVTVDVGGRAVIVRQIVGVLARRIVCRVREGDVVAAGDRFGVMKFGSRMDVFLPPDATLRVEVGDRVIGGISVIGALAGETR